MNPYKPPSTEISSEPKPRPKERPGVLAAVLAVNIAVGAVGVLVGAPSWLPTISFVAAVLLAAKMLQARSSGKDGG